MLNFFKKIIYKPSFTLIIWDIISWVLATFIILFWRTLADKAIIDAYTVFFTRFFLYWVVISYLLRRYQILRRTKYFDAFFRLATTTAIVILLSVIVAKLDWSHLSIYVINLEILIVFLSNLIFLLLYYAYRYAINAEAETIDFDERPEQPAYPSRLLDAETVKNIEATILESTDSETLDFLKQYVDLTSSNTKVLETSKLFNVASLQNYRYDNIVNLMSLNNIRGINKMFCAVNEKLSAHGQITCVFTPQSFMKEYFINTYPPVINSIIYAGHFFVRRILPKLLITSRLYYDITKAKNRVLSQTEVLGRLYYCGFEVVDYKVVGTRCVVCARRKKQPKTLDNRVYGPFIKLYRVGKNKKVFKVYKMRTMHPYSEFLQEYVYEKNNLQEGGKIKDDIRITTWGRFLRKYWLDEVPMFINLIKGDMKLVGVRPLSNHFFNLYSKELQEKRTKFKPGLLPPFYADMPKTLEEIEASEMRYLIQCEEKCVFRTDIRYFWKIMNNILFKKARSN